MQLRIKLPAICGLLFLHFMLPAQNVHTTLRAKINYPGQTLANVWGYTANGHEYALVGANTGMVIVDITDPDNPQQIVQIPAPEGPPNGSSLWKEIKTYQHYAYLVTEAGGGVQIIDLSKLPSPNLDYHVYTGDGAISGQLGGNIHALQVDEAKGFLYCWGGNLFGGGAKIMDLKPDPWNPHYVGKFDQLGYIHDGYVDNDTMYSGHIYAGYFAIVNMANKAAPELINFQTTPNAFTHNTWLAPDRKTLLTTDEKTGSFLAAYDVSDPTDIHFLDKIQSNPGSGSIVHNTYTYKNWAVSSYYRDGFTITDITRPDNLIQVANYDTYPLGGPDFQGCWGVYCYFPSGNIIASNISPGDFFIVTPEYVRACYLEGVITDGVTGQPLLNAKVEVLGSSPALLENTTANGVFKTGQEKEGYYQVLISKPGYQSYQTGIYFQHGEVVQLDVPLFPLGAISVSGKVTRLSDGLPIPIAAVHLHGNQVDMITQTDSSGLFGFQNVPPGKFDVSVVKPGLNLGQLSGQTFVTDTFISLALRRIGKKEAGHGTELEFEDARLSVTQSPFSVSTEIQFDSGEQPATLCVVNQLGQIQENISLQTGNGSITLGSGWPAGMYYVALKQGEQVLALKKIVKTKS